MRNTLVLTVLFALACAGGDAPPATVEVPPVAPPVVDVPAPPPVTVGTDPAGKAKLSPALIDQIVRARGLFDAVPAGGSFDAAHAAAIALCEALQNELQPVHEKEGGAMLELGWLTPALPGLVEGYEAEGTALVFELQPDAWKALAAKTPNADDDRLVDLLVTTYGQAALGSWEAWQERTWDYGGCKALGDGQIVEILKKTDAVKDPSFAATVAQVRAAAIDAVVTDHELFPRCDADNLEPMADAKIDAEVGRILAEVNLTPAERASIEGRRPQLKGQPHTGG